MFVALIGCVVLPPATSKDINSYALYGRMAAMYDRSPYTHTPRDFPGDPWYSKVSYYWSDSPTVYGPAFTALSAGIVKGAGGSMTATRVAFQLVDAVALVGAVAIVGRRIGWRRGVAFVGLNPLLLTFGVNDAHCDVLMGTAVVGAAVLLARSIGDDGGRAAPEGAAPVVAAGVLVDGDGGRTAWVRRSGRSWKEPAAVMAAALLCALAISVKVSAAPAVAGAMAWLWFSGRRWWSLLFGAVVAVVTALSTWVAGGVDVLAPLRQASARHTRFSLWNPIHDVLTGWFGQAPPTHSTADQVVSSAAGVVVAVVGLWMIWRHRRDATPYVALVVALVVYQLLGAYVLSWYAAWSLPVLALAWRSKAALVCMGHATWVAIAYLNGYAALAVVLLLIGRLVWARRTGDPVVPWLKDPKPRILAAS